ncbi:MAG: excinuclease ABC subunit C [Hyphomicrobiales bacterium]|nr:MAG: excinuclease ABC subunit C [Hyphomicrobiales bacterium]
MTFFVYMISNRPKGTLYIGVTNDLAPRIWEHREGIHEGFSRRYALDRLVYYEGFPSVADAIHREKRLKAWNRAWKVELIEKSNPEWEDLYPLLNR